MPSMTGKSSTPRLTGKKYWRSLNELADGPEFQEFVEREFPSQASEFVGGGESRRTFLKIMGASAALAGLASCRRWPEEKLAPYAHRPANRMDGVAVHYATAFERAGIGQGVVAVSFDGRPIKVDGNPMHPLNKGGSDVFLQASVLNVYDPDRSRTPVRREKGKREESSWEQFAKAVKGAGIGANGDGLVVLSEASRSPSVAAMRKKLSAAKWFEWETISNDNQRAGAMKAFGRPLRAVPALDKAKVIVSIDADLFQGEPLSIKFNRDFADGRKLRDSKKAEDAEMNRLYVIEGGFSITGSMADHRRGVMPSYIPTFVSALAASVTGGAMDFKALPQIMEFLEKVTADLQANHGKAVVVAGQHQPPEVHAAVAAINAAINGTVEYFAEAEDPRAEQGWTPHSEQIKAFVAAVPGAKCVLVIGANPVLTAPQDLNLSSVLAHGTSVLVRGEPNDSKTILSIHAGTHEDETAQSCQWHVPLAHYLEAWGDVRAHDGTVSIAQPLIEPIFGAKSTIEILALVSGAEQAGYDIVRETAKNEYLKGQFSEWTWKKALFDGVIANTAWRPETAALDAARRTAVIGALTAPATGPAGGSSEYELVLTTGAVYDGRYANNGWLMEMPDPMTRVSWENPLAISPGTAQELDLVSDDVVILDTGFVTLQAPVFVLPGMPDKSLALAVGYGRGSLKIDSGAKTNFGAVADGVGSNAFMLRTSKDGAFIKVKKPVKTGERPIVACVQDHHTIDTVGKNRLNTIVPELVVEGTFEEYKKKPALGTRKILALSIFNEHNYSHDDPLMMAKWGMAIDLTTCTGCSACVIACQAENNVPIVGKQMVYRGREMHWLRIDRYFKFGKNEKGETTEVMERGAAEGTGVATNDVQVVHQPILCMHCENAPCEEVCPVAATTHSHEGLNMMTYNRCIGTRYCSNNCPYKVRRFNFFDYNAGTIENLYTPNLLRDDLDELVKMQKNPQVTVRSRGVMEKCTYCVQRIEGARIQLLAENRAGADKARFKDGAVVTACQQACPTEAIVFGDLSDANSKVSKLHALAQSYGLLDPELNTKPRTQYLAKVRNNVSGLDEPLYNEHTASEGWFYERNEHGTMGNEAHTEPAAGTQPAR